MSSRKKFVFTLLGAVTGLILFFGLFAATRAYENYQFHKRAAKVHLASIQVREQVAVVQDAVEHWAEVNADQHYPAGLNDLNDAGQSVIDFLPQHRRLLSAYHKCINVEHQLSCLTEPRDWSLRLAKSDSVLTPPDGAIYYCPKPYGEGYFIRAYNEGESSPIILNIR